METNNLKSILSTIKSVSAGRGTKGRSLKTKAAVPLQAKLKVSLAFLKKKKEKTRYNNDEFDPGSG